MQNPTPRVRPEVAHRTPESTHPAQTLPADGGAAESLFQQLFGQSSEAMLLLEGGQITDCNPAALRLLGYPHKADVLSRPLAKLSPEFQPDSRASLEKADEMIAIALAQGSHRFEWMHRRVTSDEVWVELVLTRMERNGQPLLHATCREIGDRKALEAKLKQQEQLLRSTYEGVEHGVCLVDVWVPSGTTQGEFRFLGWNPAVEKRAGILSADIVGKTPEELLGPVQGAIIRQNYQRCLDAGTSISYEECVPFQGRDIWWLTTLNPLRNEQGTIDQIIITTFEISDRKAAETTIKEANTFLHSVLETIPGFFFAKDRQGRHIALNSTLAGFFGKSIGEILGKTDADLLPAEVAAAIMGKDQAIMAQNQTERFEEVVPTHGIDCTYLTVKTPLHNERGEVIGMIGLAQDISDRKAAEAALAESEAQFRLLTENVPGMIYRYIVHADGRDEFTYVSPRCKNVYHIDAELVMQDAANLWQLVHPEDANLLSKTVQDCIQAGLPLWNCDHRIITPSGQIRWIRATSQGRFQPNGDIVWDGFSEDITERKITEESLRQSEQRFRDVTEAAGEYIWEITADGIYTFLTERAKDVKGYAPDELLGHSPFEFMPPEDIAPVETIVQTAAVHKTAFTLEHRDVLPSGDIVWESVSGVPILDHCGEVIGFRGTGLSITERKQTEASLQQKEEQYRGIFENISDGIFIIDLETAKPLTVNPAVCKMHGYSHDEFIQLNPEQYVHPDSLPKFAEFMATIRSGRRFFCEAVDLHKDGTPIDIEVTGVPFTCDNKRHVLAVIRDIRDRKAAEAILKETAQRETLLNQITSQIRQSLNFEAILNTTVKEVSRFLQVDSCSFAWYCPDPQDAYWEVVAQAKIESMLSLIGRYPTTTIGFLAAELLVLNSIQIADVDQLEDTATRQLFTSLQTRAVLSIPMQTPSGLIGVLSCNHGTLRTWDDDEVKVLQAVVEQLAIALNQAELYAQSQTKAQELEQAMQELQQTQLQMIQSEKMSSLGQLVAGVAHEINNPVSFIYGNLTPANDYSQDLLNLIRLYQQHYPNPMPAIQEEIEIIDLEFVKEDLPRLLSSMKMGADRIREIVSSLRTFSRLDEAVCKEVDIHEGMDSTLVILDNRIKARPEHPAIQIVKHYGNLPKIECYAGQLNQVFMNIITNALDALEERDRTRSWQEMSQAPSAITIQTQLTPDNQAQIRLIDNGPGIPEAVQNRIFDPFFTTKAVGKGTGMGMSISYQIITENHGGTLQCISAPGQGAEFVITIPLRQQG
jgi:two-component system, NtrC family, sensor kinase